ncbi:MULTISPECIES: hypothetical protein [unclassified Butyrivibrio]|uniref:hypothetical protein n=1 Tax=unclassified Butyrivibrio TaxID=2639466 RepID=UPI0003B6C85E|nr:MULTISPECIES: hypothetical protein [unclassified Butyrivibrio]SDB29236.1 hypothetical protein SAMN02910263_01426 [Butyrivibrio sp. INlla16]SEM07416.1 hypothetical protein SAMN04487770_1259 [Butyrivibrio sp. ob235]
MIILFVFILMFIIILTLAIYLYIDECMQLRKRLLRLGVKKDEIMSFPKGLWIFRLKELLYEKETELAEECFLTVDKDI